MTDPRDRRGYQNKRRVSQAAGSPADARGHGKYRAKRDAVATPNRDRELVFIINEGTREQMAIAGTEMVERHGSDAAAMRAYNRVMVSITGRTRLHQRLWDWWNRPWSG